MLHNIVHNAPRATAHYRQMNSWEVPATSPSDVSFALKCIRTATPQDFVALLAALSAIGREASWINHEQLEELSEKTGSPISFLHTSIARVNTWLASIDRYISHFGEPLGRAGFKGREVLYQGGIPTAMILAGDSSALAAWALGQALLSGNPLIVKPSNVEPLSAFLFTQAVVQKGIQAPNLLFLDSSTEDEREMIRKIISYCGQSVIYGEDATVNAIYGSTKLSPAHRMIPYWSGRSGAIIFHDADLKQAAKCIIHGASLDRGNMCNSTKKVFAPISTKKELERLLVQEAEAIRRGHPLDATTELGRLDPVGQKMAERNASGSQMLYNHDIMIAICEDGSPLLLEETPYPILGIRYYQDSEDPVHLANETVRSTASGKALVISIFTSGIKDLSKAAELRAFKILINAPTSDVNHFIMHQGMHLALELMRPVALA
jgi:acyl-CoA reductase-like NAD-dependent aldehyde dehydrogenase